MKRLSILIVGSLALWGCEQAPTDAAPGGGGGGGADAGNACSEPAAGCACEPGTGSVDCYTDPSVSGDDMICGHGTRYCRAGQWGSCESIETFTVHGGSSVMALIDGPAECNPCNPDCSVARDYPTPADLTPGNSTDVVYDPTEGGIILDGGGLMTFMPPDGDGDMVPDSADECPGPGWRLPCDGDASDDGFYHTLEFGGAAAIDPLVISTQVRTADVYFLMDTTGSMGGEITNLKGSLTSGTYIAGCPGGVIGAIRCTIPDAWFGVGRHDDYPIVPYGDPASSDWVYRNLLNITSDTAAAQASVNSLGTHYGYDWAESQTQALWAVATGGGLGPYLAPNSGCVGTGWGYPCFRAGTIPIVVLFTDAPFHNGPTAAYNYGIAGAGYPVTYAQTIAAMNARGIKLITVHSGGAGNAGEIDSIAIANATGSTDSGGAPFVFNIAWDGTGLSTAVVDAIQELANYSRMDVTAVARDNLATPVVDETGFVNAITAVSFPAGRCTGMTATTFIQCLPGTNINFEVTFRNDFIMPTAVEQVFDFTIEVIGDGAYVLDTIPVRVVVPPVLPTFPPFGSYARTYDANTRCTIPPQRPDWNDFSWTASTPSDSSLRFEFQTADSVAGLSGAPVVSFTVPPTAPPVDIGDLLTTGGELNYMPFLRVTAVLIASSDRTVTPVLSGFEIQFTCAAAE